MRLNKIVGFASTAAIAAVLAFQAAPAEALTFSWDLGSHPDGGRATPFYGLRLDNVNAAEDDFTWDFENTDMTLTYESDAPGVNESVTLAGRARGGRDAGSDWDVSALWDINVVYTGDDAISLFSGGTGNRDGVPNGNSAPFDIFIDNLLAEMVGTVTVVDGSIDDPGTTSLIQAGDNFVLVTDATTTGNNFHYDQTRSRLDCPSDDSLIPGVCDRTHVGAGWVNIDESVLSGVEDAHLTGKHTRDFLFTGIANNVPAPGMLGLLGLGLAGLVIARRRRPAA